MAKQIETGILTLRDEAHQIEVGVKMAIRETGIHDDQEMKVATDTLAQVNAFLKRAEEARTFIVKPLNDHVKLINAEFKKITDPLTFADRSIRNAMSAFYQAKERARLEEQVRLDAQAKADAAIQGTPSLIPEVVADLAPAVDKTVKTEAATAGFRDNWTYEIIDAALVPREYLTVDGPAITKAVKSGVREIAGVRIFNEPVVAMRERQ